MKNMDKGHTVPKWALLNRLKILQMPQNLFAQIVCPSPKVWDFDEKRLHCASVVRAVRRRRSIRAYPFTTLGLHCPKEFLFQRSAAGILCRHLLDSVCGFQKKIRGRPVCANMVVCPMTCCCQPAVSIDVRCIGWRNLLK